MDDHSSGTERREVEAIGRASVPHRSDGDDQLPSDGVIRANSAGVGHSEREDDLSGPGCAGSADPPKGWAPGTPIGLPASAVGSPQTSGRGGGSGDGAVDRNVPGPGPSGPIQPRPAPSARPSYSAPGVVYPLPGGSGYYQPAPHFAHPRPMPPPPAFSRGWLALVLVASLLSAAVGAGVAAVVARNSQQTIVEKFFPNKSVLSRPQDVQEVLAKVLPAVVSITTQNFKPASALNGGNFVEGAGTGMIITSSGEVLTNNHVVAGATSVAVTLYRQTEARQATVVSVDPANDLALLKISGVSGLPRVHFGNSADVLQGDSVLAIGNALALAGGPTVTEGIISAMGRSLSARDPFTSATEHLTGLIQTDAPINPGNSGGPLVNSTGDVIGMDTAVATSSLGNAPAENVGFAIAVNTIKAMLPKLRKGNVSLAPPSGGGYMGVVVTNSTPQVRQQLGIVAHSGAVIVSVGPGSPAQKAGMRSGDVILAVNKIPIASVTALTKTLERLRPGDRVSVTLQRGGRKLKVQVVLEARPSVVP